MRDGKWVPAKIRAFSVVWEATVHTHRWTKVWMARKTVWTLINTCHIWVFKAICTCKIHAERKILMLHLFSCILCVQTVLRAKYHINSKATNKCPTNVKSRESNLQAAVQKTRSRSGTRSSCSCCAPHSRYINARYPWRGTDVIIDDYR